MLWRRLTLTWVCWLTSCCPTNSVKDPAFAQLASLQRVSQPTGAPPALPSLGVGSLWASLNGLQGDVYALDDVARRLDRKTQAKCDPSTFRTYKGTNVAYAGSVLVDPAFVERLTRFEGLVAEVALEVYGRLPNKLLHAGAYACRKSRNRATRLSEHALGNALDVMGFSFGAAPKAQRATVANPVRGAFKVTVLQHWNSERSDVTQLHRRFLRTLADRVVSANVFRVALGPSHPGHGDHLHFDMSPWSYVHL